MGSISVSDMVLVALVVALILFFGVRSPRPKHLKVRSKGELLSEVQAYAAKGFETVLDRGNLIVLNKKIPFNWVLAILMLFIPVLGWIALLILIFSNKNKVQSVTIEYQEPA